MSGRIYDMTFYRVDNAFRLIIGLQEIHLLVESDGTVLLSDESVGVNEMIRSLAETGDLPHKEVNLYDVLDKYDATFVEYKARG